MDNKITIDKPVTSKDEMNLVEFPFALLSNRQPSNCIKTLEFSDEIKGPSKNKIIREWIVTGSDIHGLPLSMDEELLMGILYLGHNAGFEGPEVYFIKKQVLDVLKWGTNKQYYQRLEMGLARLKGVSIFAKNAFWDNATKSYTTIGFGIISDFLLKNDGKGRKSNSMGREDMSMVTLDKYIYRSIKSGYIKTLDFSFWVDLETSVSKRLYRYLDKKFFRDNFFEINIDKLCHEKLGLSRNIVYKSSLMQKIEYGIKELIRKNYLIRFNVRKNNIQFVRNEKFNRNMLQTSSNADFFKFSSLIGELKAIGFDENTACRLIREDNNKIRSALNIYYSEKNRRFEKGADPVANPVGYIRTIYNNMGPNNKTEVPSSDNIKIDSDPIPKNTEENIWSKIKDHLISRIVEDKENAKEWLGPLKYDKISGNELMIIVPNELYKNHIQNIYLNHINSALKMIRPDLNLRLIS